MLLYAYKCKVFISSEGRDRSGTYTMLVFSAGVCMGVCVSVGMSVSVSDFKNSAVF